MKKTKKGREPKELPWKKTREAGASRAPNEEDKEGQGA
jgi:hypothetical protein